MRLLGRNSARRLCENFVGDAASQNKSIKECFQLCNHPRVYREGTTKFVSLRDTLLRHAEYNAVLAETCLSQAINGMHPPSAFWSLVGLYYSSFFSAHAILNMHGGWIGRGDDWLEVRQDKRGAVQLHRVKRKHRAARILGSGATHIAFWAVFYDAATALIRYAPKRDTWALRPVNSQVEWLIENRNLYNYTPTEAISLGREYERKFDARDLPNSLPGDLHVFINIATSLRRIERYFAESTGLATDVAVGSGGIENLLRRHVWAGHGTGVARFIDSLVLR